MAIKRRQFLKTSLGAVSVSLFLPDSFLTGRAFAATPDPNRRVLVVIELSGGNDGLNTVVPYTDARYVALRPTIAFKDTDLRDAAGNSTIISNQFGFHPALSKLKGLYDSGKVAVVLGVGYPNPNGSHFVSAEIWHTGNVDGDGRGQGWLGRYADLALVGRPGLPAIAVENSLPKTFASAHLVIPNTPSFEDYGLQTDHHYDRNRENKIRTLLALHQRPRPQFSFASEEARIGFDAVDGALQFQAALDNYRSTIVYPDNNPLSSGLRMLAQVITAIPETTLLYVQLGGFDHHSDQIDANKTEGQHAELLQAFSDGVDAFYRDLVEHNVADNTVILQWSEFGRRPDENKSRGTDHGAASCLFVVGNAVKGGIYGEQPSLLESELDDAGNPEFNVDFRSVYGTILDDWLGSDSRNILGSGFENIGFVRR